MFEVFIPLVLFLILLVIRKKQPAHPTGSCKYFAHLERSQTIQYLLLIPP